MIEANRSRASKEPLRREEIKSKSAVTRQETNDEILRDVCMECNHEVNILF